MMTQQLYTQWLEARTRFTNQLNQLTEIDLLKKLGGSPNSTGFLIRHIADVELLFAKNVFRYAEVKVSAKTVIDQRDTGEWTDLGELLQYQQYASHILGEAILSHQDSDWEQTITTKEFGTKTKIEALGRIMSHTAYHAGQLAIVVKYGANPPNFLK